MKYNLTILALASVTLAQQTTGPSPNGDDPVEEYLSAVCQPENATHYPLFDAPCNAIRAIEVQCLYGPAYLSQAFSDGQQLNQRRSLNIHKRQSDSDDDEDNGPALQSNVTQRACVCESQFFNQVSGCLDCYTRHGGSASDFGVTPEELTSLSSSYCAASSTPTQGFADVLYSFAPADSTATSSSASSRFTDPISNRTQVSLYFTPSVTGSAAWIVAEQTASGSMGTFTAVNTQGGQIMPTASANNAAAASASGSGGSSTTSGNAAVRTEAVAVAGVVGFAGLFALL